MKQINKTNLGIILLTLGIYSIYLSYRAATIPGAFLSNWTPLQGFLGMIIIFAMLIRIWMYNDVVLGEEKHD